MSIGDAKEDPNRRFASATARRAVSPPCRVASARKTGNRRERSELP